MSDWHTNLHLPYLTYLLYVLQACWWWTWRGAERPTWARCWTAPGTPTSGQLPGQHTRTSSSLSSVQMRDIFIYTYGIYFSFAFVLFISLSSMSQTLFFFPKLSFYFTSFLDLSFSCSSFVFTKIYIVPFSRSIHFPPLVSLVLSFSYLLYASPCLIKLSESSFVPTYLPQYYSPFYLILFCIFIVLLQSQAANPLPFSSFFFSLISTFYSQSRSSGCCDYCTYI